ncbi:MAG: electron transport complex subunit RsxC [Gammaproteobacteria bacterium]|nr:electron transport complex subunit RsxC [Gammaproteobacteria bacterium]MCP5426201.1 electron transport complex subunit RsxC [Gammaproteobacteria bacterium]
MAFIPSPGPSWRFHGGLRLASHAAESIGQAVRPAALPARLIAPLQQHIGSPAKPVAQVGESVRKGQLLAQSDGYISAAVHAPSSGVIVAIEDRPIAHPSGLSAPCLILDTDGRDDWADALPPWPDYLSVAPVELRQRVRQAGIVGLGGAAFPTAVKLNPGANTQPRWLILNGAECEPYITCDDRLMRERAADLINGARIMSYILGVEEVLIGVEDNKPQAIEALQAALRGIDTRNPAIDLRPVPTIYPAGGEKQLIKVLTGLEVPTHGLPNEIGVVCQNVGTAVSVHDAVVHGRPLISRYVTVTGRGVAHPSVLDARIGTLVGELVQQCGGYTRQAERLIIGGPMMGFAIPDDQVPIVKGCNCILVAGADELAPSQPAMPCIRCGACADVCPADLLPQQLYWHARAKDLDKTQEYHLFDCIECGCCSAVCPSHIPLVQYYRFAKTEIAARERERQQSDVARRRHEFRLERLEREKQEKETKLRKRREALQNKEPPAAPKDSTQDAVAAAIARAKAKKAGQASTPPPTESQPVAKPDADTESAIISTDQDR